MAQSPKFKPVTYAEVVRTLKDPDVQNDINSACEKLAQAMATMMGKFDALAKQMHTIDLLRHSSPLKPRWDAMRKDMVDHLLHFRTNACIISGRLKLFETAVLPMVAHASGDRSGRSSPNRESLQTLQSYTAISAEHASLAKALVDRNFAFTESIVSFVSEVTMLASRHSLNSRKEMDDLFMRLSEFEAHIKRLLGTTCDSLASDPSHLLFTCSRLVLSSGRSSGQSKITRRPILLDGMLSGVGQAYEQSDRKRNEVAHAQYAAQLRQNRTDPLATAQSMLSAFLLDAILITESALSLYLSIWSRLRNDCMEIFQHLQGPKQPTTPLVITCYLETRGGLYTPLANGLDVYAATLDASFCEKMESR